MEDFQADSTSEKAEEESARSPRPARYRWGGYISTDSEDEESFDLLRTVRHYYHSRRESSSSSECSCESCASHSDDSFFGSEEGPPGGENTILRHLYMWLENMRDKWGFLVFTLLGLSLLLAVIGWVVAETNPSLQVGRHIAYWTVPLVAVTAIGIITWTAARHILLRWGYGKGNHIMERWNLIHDTQAKELVYTVRGAIYAPSCCNSRGHHQPPVYEVVAYDSEFDPDTYFDSDLESDGQYRSSLVPCQEAEDPSRRERHNIYTRQAWFRDVPVVWWELLPRTYRDL